MTFLYRSIIRFFSLSGTGKHFQTGDKKQTHVQWHIYLRQSPVQCRFISWHMMWRFVGKVLKLIWQRRIINTVETLKCILVIVKRRLSTNIFNAVQLFSTLHCHDYCFREALWVFIWNSADLTSWPQSCLCWETSVLWQSACWKRLWCAWCAHSPENQFRWWYCISIQRRNLS